MNRVRIDVRGMTCASCSTRVEQALRAVDGVQNVAVNYATDVAVVDISTHDLAQLDILKEAVEDSGYDAVDAAFEDDQTEQPERERISDRRADEAKAWLVRWVVGAVLTVPILLLQMGPHWFGWQFDLAGQRLQLGALIALTAVTLIGVGFPYLHGAWRGLKHGSANMDTLVALGSSVAFVYSTVHGLLYMSGGTEALANAAEGTYFDGAAMILTLISVGKYLESRAKGRAGAEIEALLDLAAPHATVRRGDDWTEVPAEDVKVGDVMLVRPGERFAADAEVVDGTGSVDESMLTGESVPATRGVGDEVTGGTINIDGRLEVRALRVGSDTALAQITRVVEEAQQSKADAQRLADKISAVFVPVIIVIAIITFISWFFVGGSVAAAIAPAVAVLIVACPCALGLATPTAIMVGTGRAAQAGILIRDAAALERVRQLDVIVFDKTGTLTRGQMQVTDVEAFGVADDELMLAAASLEDGSEHPIGRAIVRHADAKLKEVSDFANEAGHGISGAIDGRAYRVGKPLWIGAQDEATKLESEGKTVVAVERDGELIGIIALRDELKDGAPDVVRQLTERGIEVWMITGDNERTARALAAEANIAPEHVLAGVAPTEKADKIDELRADGRVVAMVGDGVNDAPALANADLGIALGTGTDVAMQTADITLMGSGIDRVDAALNLSEAINRKIRQNLGWAFIYNVVLVPVAAFGYLQPMLAAGAMALSSVSVVTNSLLLKRFK